MRIRQILSTLFAAALLLTGFHGATAQVPESTEIRAQAAAMTLTADDLPTGFQLTGETFLDLPDAGIVPGATARYVSSYTNIDSGQEIRSYVVLFENEEQATSGIEVLEGNEPETTSDESVEVGAGNAELTTGTYEDADGRTIGTADVTFVRGNAVAGVAVENPDGSQPDGQLATDLATLMDTRVQQVQSGDTAIDLTLPGLIAPITANGTLIQAGFLSQTEGETIYGTQGSALSELQSSWVQTVGFGEEGGSPRVTIGITTFGSDEQAAEIVDMADNIFTPLADEELIEDIEIDGVDNVVAYRYTSREGNIADQESYRIIFSQGSMVTVVDVQGAENSETAEAAANAIVQAQIDCQGEGTCEVPVAPGVIPGE